MKELRIRNFTVNGKKGLEQVEIYSDSTAFTREELVSILGLSNDIAEIEAVFIPENITETDVLIIVNLLTPRLQHLYDYILELAEDFYSDYFTIKFDGG